MKHRSRSHRGKQTHYHTRMVSDQIEALLNFLINFSISTMLPRLAVVTGNAPIPSAKLERDIIRTNAAQTFWYHSQRFGPFCLLCFERTD